MIPLLLISAQAAVTTSMIERARDKIVATACPPDAPGDVIVCGKRSRDDYRLPLPVERPRDNAYRGDASGERAALTHSASPLGQLGPFLVGGGHAGVTVGVAFGAGEGSGKTSVHGARRPDRAGE